MYICILNKNTVYCCLMRKIILSIYVCLITVSITAQLSVSPKNITKEMMTVNDTVTVIIFDSISSSTEISYIGSETNVHWYKYTDLTTPITTELYISPEDSTGYVLDVNGVKTEIWTIDYKKRMPDFKAFAAEDKPKDQCENVNLILNAEVPLLTYKALSGNKYIIPRIYKLNYQTSQWTDKWDTIPAPTQEISLPTTSVITVPAPFSDTYFILSGDQYAKELGLKYDSIIVSNKYTAVAVKCYPTSIVQTRDQTNEGDRPSNKTDVSGSAPLIMQFLSNANLPTTEFYKWEIFKEAATEPFITHNDQDINYTFNDYGTYHVKLTVSNNNCSYVDSTITITTSISAIYAPNVFTPNGDGLNDEFRVAYKSIISFEAWVYSRWGRLVYHWTDPQKGWDGNIGGRKATPGPYFYVIKALGSDFNPNSKPDTKTHLRLGEYLLKGDINLLRGTK